MTQQFLFADERKPPPASHRLDPPTSHAAEARHTASGRRARHAEIVLGLVRWMPDATAAELWDAATPGEKRELGDVYEIRRRLSDGRATGIFRRSEHGRACSVTGKTMVTWRIA